MAKSDDAGDAKDLTCFVIGPIGDKDADAGTDQRRTYEEAIEVLEEAIEPACAGYGIPVVRADRISKSGEIPEQVFRHLRASHLVIADLTNANPNVMYELGLRHTTGKLTIQIGERGRLPFDVSVIRTILFKRSESGLVEARRRLSAAIGAALQTGGDPVTATRIWFEVSVPLAMSPPNATEADDVAEEELGYLEKIAEMMEAMDSASATLESVATVFGEVGSLSEATAKEIHKLNAAGGSASARVSAANRLASALQDPAARLAVLAGEYRQSISRMNVGVTYALELASAPDAPADAQAFQEKVGETVQHAESSLDAIDALRRSALEAGEATRSLRGVNKNIAASLSQILQTREIFESWRLLLPPNSA